jgi:hypothetical protein
MTQNITTKEQAIQYAMDWQARISDQSISYAEIIENQTELRALAERFDLVEEFEENGII